MNKEVLNFIYYIFAIYSLYLCIDILLKKYFKLKRIKKINNFLLQNEQYIQKCCEIAVDNKYTAIYLNALKNKNFDEYCQYFYCFFLYIMMEYKRNLNSLKKYKNIFECSYAQMCCHTFNYLYDVYVFKKYYISIDTLEVTKYKDHFKLNFNFYNFKNDKVSDIDFYIPFFNDDKNILKLFNTFIQNVNKNLDEDSKCKKIYKKDLSEMIILPI